MMSIVKCANRVAKQEMLILSCLILFYLMTETIFLKLPGPYPEEPIQVVDALRIKDALRNASFINIPVMRNYQGLLEGYIFLAIFSIFPIGVESMRLVGISFGAFTIFVTYFFVREFMNKYVALIAILLLIIHPGFIMGTKVGMYFGSVVAAIYMSILLCLIRWYRSKKDIYFYLGMFLLGVGMWSRLWFLWFIFGMFLPALIFKNKVKRQLIVDKPSKYLRYLVRGGLSFSLGSSAIIYHELMPNVIFFDESATRFSFVKFLLKAFTNSSIHGDRHNNFQYLNNLLCTMKRFCGHVTGRFYFSWQFSIDTTKFTNLLYPLTLFVGISCMLIFVMVRKNFPYRKNILFLLILFIGAFMVTPLSPSNLPSYHFYFFYPLVQMIIAAAIISSIQYLKRLKIIMMGIVIFTSVLIAKELNGLYGYFYYLKNIGGRCHFSPASYELVEYLFRQKPASVIVGSGGLNNILHLSLYNRAMVYYAGGPHSEIESLLIKDNGLYVFYSKEIAIWEHNLENFIAEAKRLNLNFVEVKRFYEKDGGGPIYLVYGVR